MIWIELQWSEMLCACTVGVMRRLSSMSKGYDKNKHAEISNFQTDIEGAIGEKCFAKWQCIYWAEHIGSFKKPDVGLWQVRATSHRNGHLIVRPNDKPGERVALLIIHDVAFGADLVGWYEVDHAKVDKWWREDKNSWWVPQRELHAFEPEVAAC
jgi:hypothetical protein